jgi:hypothetical protein
MGLAHPLKRIAGGALAVGACLALGTASASAATVTCPAPQTYTITAGDPPLALHGGCTGDGTLTYTLVSGPSNGSLTGSTDGNATYVPAVGFQGTDQFTYRATDSIGQFAEATVTIIVNGPPSNGLPPSCPDPVHVYVPADGSVTLAGNCSDPEGGPITYGIVTLPLSGGATFPDTHTLVYKPPSGVTSDSFVYSATDGQGNVVQAHVLFTVTAPGTTEVSSAPAATAGEPFVAGVATATSAAVTIGARTTSVAPPAGYFLLGTEFNIVAPDQTAASPLRLTFTIDVSQLPQTGDPVVFRDGVPIEQVCLTAGVANPDPCVASRTTLGDGDVQITILSSHASRWNLGAAIRVLPATADQCKGDGWKRFRDGNARFKNQGDCVSYVATHGKNRPAA